MFWKLLSLMTVTIGFLALVVWVYLPRNKSRLEAFARIPMLEKANDSDEFEQGRVPR